MLPLQLSGLKAIINLCILHFFIVYKMSQIYLTKVITFVEFIIFNKKKKNKKILWYCAQRFNVL